MTQTPPAAATSMYVPSPPSKKRGGRDGGREGRREGGREGGGEGAGERERESNAGRFRSEL